MLRQLVTFLSILLFIAGGCGPKAPKTIQVHPDKKTLADSLSVLKSRSQDVQAMQMRGRCVWEHKRPTEKTKKEEFTVKIWINPPAQIRLQGDVAFNPKGLLLGGNENEFWLAIKPEINSFWWGKWAQQPDNDRLIISPGRMLEAIGVIRIEDETMWSVRNENGLDILTKRTVDSRLDKKIYFSGPDHTVAKIEYFDATEKPMIAIELEKYEKVNNSFSIPNIIKTISYNNDGSTDSFKISISSAQQKEFSDKQKTAIFSLPPSAGYKNVYQIIGGNAVEFK